MKKIFFIAGFMLVGLFLEVAVSFADDSWESTGPTAEDMGAVTKIENLAVKESLEDGLIHAVKTGDLKNVETFIAKGAGLEARDNENMTALMRAAEKGYSDIARTLIAAGADINAKDKFGRTAFFMATDKNHVDIVKMLIAKGVAVDSNFEDLFVSSVFKGNTEMVKVLIASDGIKDSILNNALHCCRYGSELHHIILEALNKEKF